MDSALLYWLSYNRLMFELVSHRWFEELATSMSESTPRKLFLSGGGADLWNDDHNVKHSVILQAPVSKRCHMLALIVMGGSGRLNQHAPDLYFEYELKTHTDIYNSNTLCLSCMRSSSPHTRIKSWEMLHRIALHHFFFGMSSISLLSQHLMSFSVSLPTALHVLLISLSINVMWTHPSSGFLWIQFSSIQLKVIVAHLGNMLILL